jgi:hypothetical protein
MAKRYPPIIGRPEALTIWPSAPLPFVQTRNNARVRNASVKIETERTRYSAHASRFTSTKIIWTSPEKCPAPI